MIYITGPLRQLQSGVDKTMLHLSTEEALYLKPPDIPHAINRLEIKSLCATR